MALIQVRGLSRAYGAVQAAADVAFEIAGGEILGLLGPNGAGKTTTIECVIGLKRPDAGQVTICGVDALASPQAARAMIGVALQSTGLADKITPREALTEFVRFYPAPADPEELLARFGLGEKADARYETLSGGQKQRVALALAFAGNPKAVFLDEPTAGLDLQMRRELHWLMRAMRTRGCAVLLATHDMEEARLLCDRIAVMARGRIVATDTPDALAGDATLEDAVLALTGVTHA